MQIVNFNLLTPENIVTIGAILFFWACVAYALRSQFVAPDTSS